MIDRIVSFVLKQRVVVVISIVLVAGMGIFAFKKIPIDAFPDVTNVQVQVIVEAPGRSPIEVEKFVTFPIEVQMTGLPKLTELRSLSKFGLSTVTVVFKDEVDIYFARQLVLERLIQAKESLPEGINPVLGPISSGLGEIYQYTLERPDDSGNPKDSVQDLMDLRTIQDWMIRPILKTLPGVADVNAFGGYVKQYQVIVDAERLIKYNLTLREVFEALAANNSNAGGNVLEHFSEQYIIRGIGLIQTIQDIEDIVVKQNEAVPVYMKDVARVTVGPEFRQGALVVNGRKEGVAGIVMMMRGASGREVVSRVKEKVKEINRNNILPDGIKIKPFYDRSELVERCIHTVTKALGEGVFFIVIILYLFLRNFRGALVVSLTLPLVVLITFIAMWKTGLSANLMSLGGLAISLGMIVDSAIIQIENVQRHLAESGNSQNKFHIMKVAALEIMRPSIFGVLIIAITFIPILTLEGLEGKMFAPLALTVVIAVLASLAVAILIIPVLSSFFLNIGKEKESFFMVRLNRFYSNVLRAVLRRKKKVVSVSIALLAGSFLLIPFLGTEFIPALDEGSLTPQIIRLPSISLGESINIEKVGQQIMMKFPEVEAVVSKIGTAEIATDPMGPNLSDPIVILKPKKYWKVKSKEELIERIREELSKIPGIGLNISQPIALRVDELISGVKSQIAVKLFGDDMSILKLKADEIAKIVGDVKGVEDLRVEQVSGQPYIEININRRKIARYGINVADIQEIIETAIGGKEATNVFEGEKRFALLLRLPEVKRNSVEAIGNILVASPVGSKIPLAQLASIDVVEGPIQISRENSKRRIVIECNVRGRDIGSFVAESRKKLKEKVQFPAGYYLEWGGAFENQQRAMGRLMIIVPITIVIIYFLLFITFNSLKQALLVIINLPFALVGGIVGLFISKMYLSVPASIGFIALFGVAVLNGVVLVSCINSLRQEGIALEEAIINGCRRRLRPVLMTALVTIFALVPLLFATGPGSEIQKPLAVVVVGGLVTSTLLTLVVLPVLYSWFERKGRFIG